MVFAFISNIFQGGSNIPADVTKSFWEDRHPWFGLTDHRYTAAAAATTTTAAAAAAGASNQTVFLAGNRRHAYSTH